MKPYSLVRQFVGATLLTLLVLWMAVVVSVAWVVRHETNEIFDGSLQETAQRLLPLAVAQLQAHAHARDDQKDDDKEDDDEDHVLETDEGALEPAQHEEYMVYQVFDAAGHLLLRSHAAPAAPLTADLQPGFQRAGPYMVYIERSRNGQYLLALAEYASHRSDTLLSTLKYLLMPLLVLLPLSALGMLLIARRASRPLRLLTHEVARRGSSDLQPVATAHLPKELLPLSDTLNQLMQRLKSALEAERHFTANSAHELRTPLAAALAQLDVLAQSLDRSEQVQRLQTVRQMLERLQKLSEKLLQLARAESGIAWRRDEVDLKQLLTMLCRDHQWRADMPIALHLPDAPLVVQGDVDALGIVLNNLLENAIKYGTPTQPIRVIASAHPLQVRVINDSEPLPQATLARLHERFFRVRPDSRGAGLGLSIVRALLAPTNVELQLYSPVPGEPRGFEARLVWRDRPGPHAG
ncbi:MAG: histidine kinase dimerization/phospho-acceptor domain-containing protein [Pseudomonadota bacterium]|jgi:two-component system OmpR family sensor kinase